MRSSGHPLAFGLAIGVIGIWALTGPFFHFSNTWLLVIDTIANIITFLMIFLIRNAQNRESEAVQLKLDELIRATKEAHNSLLDIEELSEEELDRSRHVSSSLPEERGKTRSRSRRKPLTRRHALTRRSLHRPEQEGSSPRSLCSDESNGSVERHCETDPQTSAGSGGHRSGLWLWGLCRRDHSSSDPWLASSGMCDGALPGHVHRATEAAKYAGWFLSSGTVGGLAGGNSHAVSSHAACRPGGKWPRAFWFHADRLGPFPVVGGHG